MLFIFYIKGFIYTFIQYINISNKYIYICICRQRWRGGEKQAFVTTFTNTFTNTCTPAFTTTRTSTRTRPPYATCRTVSELSDTVENPTRRSLRSSYAELCDTVWRTCRKGGVCKGGCEGGRKGVRKGGRKYISVYNKYNRLTIDSL